MLPLDRRLLGCLVCLLAIGLTACQADETTAADGSDGPPTGSPTASPSPTSAGGSSATPAPVTPAAGPELALTVTSLHAPEGWAASEDQLTSFDLSARGKGGSLQLIELAGATDVGPDASARLFLESQPEGARTQRLPDVSLGQDGTRALRFAWTLKGDDTHYESVQAYHSGSSVTVNFTLAPTLLDREPDLVESVLASLEWRA